MVVVRGWGAGWEGVTPQNPVGHMKAKQFTSTSNTTLVAELIYNIRTSYTHTHTHAHAHTHTHTYTHTKPNKPTKSALH